MDHFPRFDPDSSPRYPYLRAGVPTGLLGAAAVAVFFFLMDLFAGRPLATPNALGASLFLGHPVDLSRALDPPVILAYTVLHGVVFMAFGCVAASFLLGRRSTWTDSIATRGVAIAGALFAASTLVFAGLTLLLEPSAAWRALGIGRVLAANLLGSVAMAVPLSRLRPWAVEEESTGVGGNRGARGPGAARSGRDPFPRILGSQLAKKLVTAAPDNDDRDHGYALVDVLPPESFADEHIPGSINVPHDRLDAIERRFGKRKEIIVYCASRECDASERVAEALTRRGFSRVVDYEGGLRDWAEGRRALVGRQHHHAAPTAH